MPLTADPSDGRRPRETDGVSHRSDPARVSFPQKITIPSDPWQGRGGRGDGFEPQSEDVIIPVVVQSCRLIPALLLPHADPVVAKPRRDHRFLDRVSRHEVPKTPGNDDAFKVYDPARVSH